jgi:hypothetical protein
MHAKLLAAALTSLAAFAAQASTAVFSSDFDTTLPAEVVPGTANLTGVQNYAGLGPIGDQFSGSFLRSITGNTVTLSLSNLPTHTSINLSFLFAAIDSLDGTGSFPSGDFFRIDLDGQQIFRESFANADISQIQSYDAYLVAEGLPANYTTLARHQDLGFSGPGGYYTDSAYNFGADPAFTGIAHSGSTATFTFVIEGQGIQDLNDESWAMDNLQVSVNAVPEVGTPAMLLAGLGLLGAVARRNQRK